MVHVRARRACVCAFACSSEDCRMQVALAAEQRRVYEAQARVARRCAYQIGKGRGFGERGGDAEATRRTQVLLDRRLVRLEGLVVEGFNVRLRKIDAQHREAGMAFEHEREAQAQTADTCSGSSSGGSSGRCERQDAARTSRARSLALARSQYISVADRTKHCHVVGPGLCHGLQVARGA